MAIVDKLMKLAGKDGMKIDPRISKIYFINQCWQYGWMLIRGVVYSCGKSQISRKLFKGKKVKIRESKYLSIDANSRLADGVYIDALSRDGVRLGSYVILGRNSRIECTGGLSAIGKGISISDNTSFGSDCYFGAAGGITIGKDVVAGQYIRFHSENHNYSDLNIPIREQGVSHKGIVIGDNCWIGAGAVFLDGAELGNGCVVAANAVVTKKFPDNSVIGGIPAKIIKNRVGK